MDPSTTSPRRRRVPTTIIVWLASIAAIIVLKWLDMLLGAVNIHIGIITTFFSFLAWLTCIGLTLYGLAVGARWLLRKLFWTVGRRLFLSYVMIGMLPFFLFAILLAVILYVVAGVASQANFKAVKQAGIGQLEAQNIEYALQGKTPHQGDGTIEILDSQKDGANAIPTWLRKSNFSGMVLRGEAPVLVASHQYPVLGGGEPRTIVLAQPLDEKWGRQLEERTGMIIAQKIETHGINIHTDGNLQTSPKKKDDDDESPASRPANHAMRDRGFSFNRNLFFDVTEEGGLMDWTTGQPRPGKKVFTAISNPYSNLLQFYFGGATSSAIMRGIFNGIAGLTGMLLIMYLFASAFAAVLIFSISRAVNRIEKGTKAVERGDFSYRIAMKRNNQLGAMAQSFDHMTESIASLLITVAEKERLQSEIEIAASIQRNLLPKEGPQFRGVSFSAHFEPTASIGGDYYDVFNLDKSRLAVAIGDVSGHGLSTGLVMAMVKAAITTLVEEGADETSLFRRLNDLVYRSTERRAFMTLAFTIFDLEHGTIRHTNAGHLYPYLLRKEGPPIPIESPSLPLGVRSDLTTHTVEMDLGEGDTIVYLSDGIVEAQDEGGDPFGFEQLEALLGAATDRSPSAIRDAILAAVARHAGTRPADDDRTVMVLRFENFRTSLRLPEPAVLAEATA